MPNYLFKSKNFVLIHYQEGKRYVTADDHELNLPQALQKGNTCEYYSFLHRPRFGKKIEELKTLALQTQDPDALELIKWREIEKTISSYRKSKTALELRDNTRHLLINIHKKHVDDYVSQLRKHAKDSEAYINAKDNEEYIEEMNNLILFLMDFKTQSEYKHMYDYLNDIHSHDLLELHKQLLQDLGHNPFEVVNTLLHESGFPSEVSITDIAPEEREIVYAIASSVAISKAYQLKDSALTKTSGIEGVQACLSNENVLTVAGRFGRTFYDGDPDCEGALTEHYEVYSWKSNNYDITTDPSNHKVILVGAELENGKGFVYYVDPNDSSEPNQPRKLYKISYEQFISAVDNVFGIKKVDPSEFDSQQPTAEGPFAVYTDPELVQKFTNQYRKVYSHQQGMRFFHQKYTAVADFTDDKELTAVMRMS